MSEFNFEIYRSIALLYILFSFSFISLRKARMMCECERLSAFSKGIQAPRQPDVLSISHYTNRYFFVCRILRAKQVTACEQHAARLAQTSAHGRKVRPEIGHLLRNAPTNVRASPFSAHIAQVASFTAKFKKFVLCEWPRKLCQPSHFAVVWPKAHENTKKKSSGRQ